MKMIAPICSRIILAAVCLLALATSASAALDAVDDGRLVALGFRWYLLHAGAVHGGAAPASSGSRDAGAQGHRRRAGWVVRRNGCWPGHSRAVPPRHRRPARVEGEVTGTRLIRQGSDTVACKEDNQWRRTQEKERLCLRSG